MVGSNKIKEYKVYIHSFTNIGPQEVLEIEIRVYGEVGLLKMIIRIFFMLVIQVIQMISLRFKNRLGQLILQ